MSSTSTIEKEQDSALDIGNRILHLRKRLGLTQVEMAARLSIAKSTFVAWERGEAEAGARLFTAVKRCFGYTAVLDLLGEPENSSMRTDWLDVSNMAVNLLETCRSAGVEIDVKTLIHIAGYIYEKQVMDRLETFRYFDTFVRLLAKAHAGTDGIINIGSASEAVFTKEFLSTFAGK